MPLFYHLSSYSCNLSNSPLKWSSTSLITSCFRDFSCLIKAENVCSSSCKIFCFASSSSSLMCLKSKRMFSVFSILKSPKKLILSCNFFFVNLVSRRHPFYSWVHLQHLQFYTLCGLCEVQKLSKKEKLY